MTNIFSSFLCFFDWFHIPVAFKHKNKSKLQTSFSGIISAIIYALTLLILVVLIKDLIDKKHQTIVMSPNNSGKYQNLTIKMDYETFTFEEDLNTGLFFWAIKFVSRITGEDMLLSDIEKLVYLEFLEIERFIETGDRNIKTYITLERCGTQFNFFPVPEKDIVNWYCPKMTEFKVQGEYFDKIFRYISLKIKECNNEDNPIAKYCHGVTSIKEKLADVEIKFINSKPVLDPTKTNNDIPLKFTSEQLSLYPNFNFRYENDIFLSRSILTSYENLILYFSNPNKISFIDTINNHERVTNHGGTFIAIYFRSDIIYNDYIRTYKNLFQILAQIGGIFKVLVFIASLFTVVFNTKFLFVAISNKVFDLISSDKDIEKENYEGYKAKLNPNDPQKEMKIENVTSLEAKMCIEYFKYSRLKNIDYSMKDVFADLFCFHTSTQQKNNDILALAEKRLNKKLETKYFYQFLGQIKMLKSIILNDLYFISNLQRKEYLTTENTQELENRYKLFLYDENSTPQNQTLLKEIYFINGLRSIQQKPLIDKKIDKNLIKIFRIDEELLRNYFIAHYHCLKNKKL